MFLQDDTCAFAGGLIVVDMLAEGRLNQQWIQLANDSFVCSIILLKEGDTVINIFFIFFCSGAVGTTKEFARTGRCF